MLIMEYRRRRTAAGRRKNKDSGSPVFLQTVVILLVFGALAYMLLGTGLGKKLKDRYAVSLYDSIKTRISGTPAPTVPPIATQAPSPAPTVVPTGETSELSLPGIEVIMLQMGVFTDMTSAYDRAAAMKAMGGAGYLYDDGGTIRLIAAAYADDASAESVRERLIGEGYEAGVYRVSQKGVDLMITASPERLLPIRTAFSLAGEIVSELDSLSLTFDADTKSVEYGMTVLSEIKANIENAAAGIGPTADSSDMLFLVREYYTDVLSLINEALASSSERTAFSSSVKLLRIRTSLRYVSLLRSIGG